jgi:hypothetical protein
MPVQGTNNSLFLSQGECRRGSYDSGAAFEMLSYSDMDFLAVDSANTSIISQRLLSLLIWVDGEFLHCSNVQVK